MRGGGGGVGVGQGSEYWWGGKLFVGCKLIRDPAPKIITFPTLKTDNTANLKKKKKKN